MEDTNGDLNAAQEAERMEISIMRDEKKAKDEANFRHFEEIMRQGKEERERLDQIKLAEEPQVQSCSRYI